MDQPLKETPKQVYAEPTLQERGRLVEVTEGEPLGTSGAIGD